jgi:hypothetical protein
VIQSSSLQANLDREELPNDGRRVIRLRSGEPEAES